MFGILIELLTGRYVATEYNDRDAAEWPPHPARLFSALVATWAEGEPETPSADAELAALRWLERQDPPVVLASGADDVAVRSVPPVFVPVNDIAVISAPDDEKLRAAEALAASTEGKARTKAQRDLDRALKKLESDTAKAVAAPAKPSQSDLTAAERLFPDQRVRQPRTFPSVTPTVPRFAFVWPLATPGAEHRGALARLMERLARVGHSSSMVHARLVDQETLDELAAQTARHEPDADRGSAILRWVGPGQCDRLIASHARHGQVEPRVLPALFLRYRVGARAEAPAPPRGPFDADWYVFSRIDGPTLPLVSAAGLSRQFRRALMAIGDQPTPEFISGHQPDGTPSVSRHVAIVPLPFVGHAHADGAIRGLAIIPPAGATLEERSALQRAIAAMEERGRPDGSNARVVTLELGATGVLRLQRTVWGEPSLRTLRPSAWIGPAKCWASATPVALDRNPGDLHDPDPQRRSVAFEAARSEVLTSIERFGLPPPVDVDVVRSTVLAGSSKPRAFPRFPASTARPQRVLVHVRLAFASPVVGPLLLGAGRYHGLGLFQPVDGPQGGR